MTPDNKPAAPGLVEALAAMLHYFDSPKRDDWLDETNWRSACSACQMAHAALEAYKRALTSQPVPSAPEPSEDIARLMKFYSVTTVEELVAAQSHHVERLQAKLPKTPSLAPTFQRG